VSSNLGSVSGALGFFGFDTELEDLVIRRTAGPYHNEPHGYGRDQQSSDASGHFCSSLVALSLLVNSGQ
jgi:hypothetical protein